MSSFLERALVPSPKRHHALPVGLHHYVRTIDGAPVRYHLRIEPDGGAILLANASQMLSLTAHGAVAAKAILDGGTPALAMDGLVKRFRLSTDEDGLTAVRRLAKTIDAMAAPGGGVVATVATFPGLSSWPIAAVGRAPARSEPAPPVSVSFATGVRGREGSVRVSTTGRAGGAGGTTRAGVTGGRGFTSGDGGRLERLSRR